MIPRPRSETDLKQALLFALLAGRRRERSLWQRYWKPWPRSAKSDPRVAISRIPKADYIG
jgi:hypothetical protein